MFFSEEKHDALNVPGAVLRGCLFSPLLTAHDFASRSNHNFNLTENNHLWGCISKHNLFPFCICKTHPVPLSQAAQNYIQPSLRDLIPHGAVSDAEVIIV